MEHGDLAAEVEALAELGEQVSEPVLAEYVEALLRDGRGAEVRALVRARMPSRSCRALQPVPGARRGAMDTTRRLGHTALGMGLLETVRSLRAWRVLLPLRRSRAVGNTEVADARQLADAEQNVFVGTLRPLAGCRTGRSARRRS